MKRLMTTLALALALSSAIAQIVTDKDLASPGYGEKKLKKAPKKVFINQFVVNYQVLSSSSEASSKSKTQMTVGLTGIEAQDLQDITDNAYEMIVDKLENAGFEIVSADEAGQTEFYNDWTRVEGGTPSQAQLMGYISTSPNDFDFYVKKINKDGKNKGTFFDTTPKLSKQLGDIPVLEANVNFQYVTISGTTYINDATKLKGVVNYEIPPSAIAQSAEGIFGSKIETNPTSVRVVWKGGAAGAGALAMIALTPKKGIAIPGVLEEKKFKEYASPNVNYNNSFAPIVIQDRKEITVSHQVKADREAYIKKTQQALNEYLSIVVDSFIANANG